MSNPNKIPEFSRTVFDQTQIILISGKQGSGKTSLSEKFKSFGLGIPSQFNVVQVGFMKFARILYELTDQMVATLKQYNIEITPDQRAALLQLLGTDWGRKMVASNIWADALKNDMDGRVLDRTRREVEESKHRTYAQKSEKDYLIVIDDMRFLNEMATFPGAFRVRLEAPESVRKSRAEKWRDNVNHASEIGLDGCSHLFDVVLDTSRVSADESFATLIGSYIQWRTAETMRRQQLEADQSHPVGIQIVFALPKLFWDHKKTVIPEGPVFTCDKSSTTVSDTFKEDLIYELRLLEVRNKYRVVYFPYHPKEPGAMTLCLEAIKESGLPYSVMLPGDKEIYLKQCEDEDVDITPELYDKWVDAFATGEQCHFIFVNTGTVVTDA